MKNKVLWILLAIFVLGLLIWFLGKKPPEKMGIEGVTNTEIHIAQWSPQTGRASAWGVIARGTGDYFKMINAEGGIYGRKVVYHIVDDSYHPARTRAGVKQLQESVGVFAWVGGAGAANGVAVMDYLMERKVPWVGNGSPSKVFVDPPKKYIFATAPLYDMEGKVLVRYVLKNQGKKRIGIIYQNDEYGKEGLKGSTEQLAKYGMKLVAEVPIQVTDIDVKPHVMRLRKARADAVLLYVTPDHALRILGTAHALKFYPQWMGAHPLSDFYLMHEISKGLYKGVIVAIFGEPTDSNAPLMQKYRKAFAKYAAKGERWSPFYYFGYSIGEVVAEALKRCGRDLTRERFVKELESFKNFTGIGGPISFKTFDTNDPSCRQGLNSVYLVECLEGGKYKKLTDYMSID